MTSVHPNIRHILKAVGLRFTLLFR